MARRPTPRSRRVSQVSRVVPLAALQALLFAIASAPAASKEVATSEPPGVADDKPAFFTFGPHQVGLLLGYGHGVGFAGSGQLEGKQVQELVILPYWQFELTRRPIEPAWYKGTLGFRTEATVLVNFSPRTGVAGGLGLLLRYSFTRADPLIPYVQAGAGPIALSFDIFEQADGLAFIPQAGAGLVYRLNPRLSFDLGVRFQHISNAYTQSPNGGIDTLQVLLGAAYHF